MPDRPHQLPRYMSDGSVYDRMPPTWFTILSLYLGKFLPTFYNWMMNKLILSTMKKEFPDLPDSWGFLPAPSPMVAPPLIGSECEYRHGTNIRDLLTMHEVCMRYHAITC